MLKGKHHISKWNSKGGGLHKHALSGHPHNHRHSIERTREYNQEMERVNEIKKKQKTKLYGSVQEAFKERL